MTFRKGQRVRWKNTLGRTEEGTVAKQYKDRHDGFEYVLITDMRDGGHATICLPQLVARLKS